jgi:Amidohydrolase ring-opening protein (Amido_AtzD_TrzD)
MAGPAAMSGLIGLIEDGALDPAHIAAILVKTEGNGGVNNFTREYTCATICGDARALSARHRRRGRAPDRHGGVLRPHGCATSRLNAASCCPAS